MDDARNEIGLFFACGVRPVASPAGVNALVVVDGRRL
jgi:hypothetical protein